MAIVDTSSIDQEQINGAFALAVDVRFDAVSSGFEQKVFEYSNAGGTDKIWFGQIGNSNDVEFVIVQDGIEYRTIAKDALVEGETIVWRVGVDTEGVMRISNDTEVLAQGLGVVPIDVERSLVTGGVSQPGDTVLSGSISNLKMANYGNLDELDPTSPDSPCALTGESQCMCTKLRPAETVNEGEDGPIVISSTDAEGDGEWSNVSGLAIIPIHAIVLPDGKVLSYGSTENGSQGGQLVYSLFDPATGIENVLPNTTGTNIFCSDMKLDPVTGNVIIMGGDAKFNNGAGNVNGLAGINDVLVFDYKTQTMREADQGDLQYARYYGTTVTLASGEIMMIGGRDENYRGSVYAEVFNSETGIRTLTGARIDDIAVNPNGGGPESLDGNYWYPHVFVNSRGEVITIMADGGKIYRMTTDGTGTVEAIGETPFADYTLNPSAMYAVDKIVMTDAFGGLWTADISESRLNFVKVADLDIAHTSGFFVSLPDGRVAIVGGSEARNQGNNLAAAEKAVKIWDPSDNSIETMAEATLEHLYHSTHLMLPDGTIWSGGGGSPGPFTNTNVEFFRPDYFYDETGALAERPDITDAPSNVASSSTFRVSVDDTATLEKITAIKSGGMTHARNPDQRFVELDYTVVDGTTIDIEVPNANIMIPGLWMLYAVDDKGVPSEASMLGIDMAALVETAPLEQKDLVYFNIDNEQINGAFELEVEARFDDLSPAGDAVSGFASYQRVFDFGNGRGEDNIFLSQVGSSSDMMFRVYADGRGYTITASNVIVEGEMAKWKVAVDETGYMRMWKNDALVAEGQGAVPDDVVRTSNLIGYSNWGWDKRLDGEVRNLEITNETADNTQTYSFDGNTYMLGTEGLTYEQAVLEAEALGGHVVVIDSQAENDFIFNTFGGSAPIWLGISDAASEGDFVDANGVSATYTNWLPGEPNDFSGGQDYAMMSSILDGRWDDINTDGGYIYDGSWRGGYTNRTVIEIEGGQSSTVFITAPENVLEGAKGETGTLEFTIGLDRASDQDITVIYNVLGSTLGSDVANQSLTIPAGDTRATLSLTFTGDNMDELDELVTVQLESATNATINANSRAASVTILDDDEPVSPVLELSGEAGDFAVYVDDRGAYTAVRLATGEVYDLTGVTEVKLVDTGETYSIDVVRSVAIPLPQEPNLPFVSIAAPADVSEGATGETGSLVFTVSISKTSADPVTASVIITGSATGPSTVTVPAGRRSVDLVLSFAGDDVREDDEAITVSLSNVVGANSAFTEATALIVDDDAPPPVVLELSGQAEDFAVYFDAEGTYTAVRLSTDESYDLTGITAVTLVDTGETFSIEIVRSVAVPIPTDTLAPLILDLDNNGVSFTTAAFDFDSDGKVETGGWTEAGDGFLALDRNGNGTIDNGSELSFTQDLAGAMTDLEGLAAYDTNGDGKLSALDSGYEDFRVWTDLNRNGLSEAGELNTLTDLEIESIDLTGDDLSSRSAEAEVHGFTTVNLADGSTVQAADVSLVYNGDGLLF